MGSSVSVPKIVRPEVAGMYAVHNLESSDFVCLPIPTESLLVYVQMSAVDDRPAEGKEGQMNCLQRIVRHFIEESLGARKEGASSPESCLVSVGVIKGNRVLAVEPDKGIDVPFTSRLRNCDQDVFCWFISVATVQIRCCLLTQLSLGDLSSASSATVVERINHGDLGYYVCRRREQRLIHKMADISFSFVSDEIYIRQRHREFDEAPLLALFSANSPMLALSPYNRRFAVAFMCSQWDFEQAGAKAFGNLAAVTPLEIPHMRQFCYSCGKGVLPIVVIDVDYLRSDGVKEFLLELVGSSFKRHELRPEIVAFYDRISLMPLLTCAYTVLGPMTVPVLQSSVLTSIIRQRLCG